MLPKKNWDWDRSNALVNECYEKNRYEVLNFKGLQLCCGMSPQLRFPDVPIYSSMLREGIYGP